jgi:DNA-binding transcriptional ArsR family regulator
MSNDWDDDVHKALAHPTRRRIIEYLIEKKFLSFTDMLKFTDVPNHGKLGFHLRALEGLVQRDPSTNKYYLTDRGLLAGELIWRFRSTMAEEGSSLMHEPLRYVRSLKLGDHAVLFYDTEEIKREISFPFLRAGLLKGEAVIYIVSENKWDSEKREFQRYGISVDNQRKEAFTIMSADEWYIRKGKAQAKTIVDNWLTLLKEKQKAGFIGLRAATEMISFFNYAKSKELLLYEATLGIQLAPALCGLCLYETRRLDEQQFIQLNHSHGHSIFKGIAFKTI